MPRKAGTGTKSDRQRIQFAYNADREMAIGVVFRYLIDNPLMSSREGKHKGLDAMSAFWKPFAYQECTDSTEEDLQVLAREAMEALAHQMALISSTFGVEPPKTENTPQQEQLQEMIQQAVTAAMLNLVESGAIVMPQSSPIRYLQRCSAEGVNVDDAMFAGLTPLSSK
jgi:hypothetical protein